MTCTVRKDFYTKEDHNYGILEEETGAYADGADGVRC